MVELVNGIDFHNFNLDCKPKEWFKGNNELSNRDICSLVDINTKELK